MTENREKEIQDLQQQLHDLKKKNESLEAQKSEEHDKDNATIAREALEKDESLGVPTADDINSKNYSFNTILLLASLFSSASYLMFENAFLAVLIFGGLLLVLFNEILTFLVYGGLSIACGYIVGNEFFEADYAASLGAIIGFLIGGATALGAHESIKNFRKSFSRDPYGTVFGAEIKSWFSDKSDPKNR